MYSKGPTITLKNSASYIPGNLAVFAGLERESSATYAVAHRSTVLVAHSTSGMCTHTQTSYDDMNDRDPACFLTQASRCAGRQAKNDPFARYLECVKGRGRKVALYS